MVSAQGWQALPADLQALVSAELNVVTLEPLAGDLVDVTAKANYRALGKRFGQRTPDVAAAIGVVLVIGVLLISLLSRKLLERD
jgi:isoleucyl-tRNA synthetase